MFDFAIIKKSLFEVERPQKYGIRGTFLRYLFGKKKVPFWDKRYFLEDFAIKKVLFLDKKRLF